MSGLALDSSDRAILAGEHGRAARRAMGIVSALAGAVGARRLLDVASAHIDGCLYHGAVGLAFAERLADEGARVRVPTTLNVSALDLLHPQLVRLDAATRDAARRQMEAYEGMGCRPTWTCAPYQLPDRPAFGQHVAWAESNAIVFANSVLGARTGRYGDFIDICAAITGRVPAAGLHLTENRRGQALFRLRGIPERAFAEDALFALLGHAIGTRAGSLVPVIDGLPAGVSEDQLKALGAAAASSGAVALCHVIGVTPEAPSLREALHGRPPVVTIDVTRDDLLRARNELTTSSDGRLFAVSLGTPHFSIAEFGRLTALIAGASIHPDVTLYVSTGRDVLEQMAARGWLPVYERPGVRIVVDTCTYITPILARPHGGGRALTMTNSAKWAWYAPGNIGVDVAFGTLAECVASAVEGRVVRVSGWLDG